MSFDLLERSRWLGSPVALYLFARRTKVWRFVNAERDFTVGGDLYVAAQISQGSIRDSTAEQKNNLIITVPYLLDPNAPDLPATQSLGNNWRPHPPSDIITVTCMTAHRGNAEVQVNWSGRILPPRFTGTELVLTCEPTHTATRRPGLQRKWCRGCDLVLYSQGFGMCNVDKALHAVPAELTAVSGLTLTSPAFAAVEGGRLEGGFVEFPRADGLTDYRSIMRHTGSVIEVNYGAPEFATDFSLTAYPGCRQDWASCQYFDNEDNFGGCLYLPVKNPMGGMPVW